MSEFVFNLDQFMKEAAPKWGTTEVDEAPIELLQKCKIAGTMADPVSGKLRVFVHRCKKHRECLHCAAVRASEFHQWIISTMSYNNVTELCRVDLEDEADYRKYRDKYGSDKVMRMPVEDGTVLLIAKESEGEQIITLDNIDNEFLLYVSSTPERKRSTGGHKPKQKKEEGEEITVVVKAFLIDTEDQAAIQLAASQAEKQTANLKPNAETLQDALNAREDVFVSIVREMGFEVFSLAKEKRIKVLVSKISW